MLALALADGASGGGVLGSSWLSNRSGTLIGLEKLHRLESLPSWAANKTARAAGRYREMHPAPGPLTYDADGVLQLTATSEVILSWHLDAALMKRLSAWDSGLSIRISLAHAPEFKRCQVGKARYTLIRASYAVVPWSAAMTPWKRVQHQLRRPSGHVDITLWGTPHTMFGLGGFCVHGLPAKQLFSGVKGESARLIVKLERRSLADDEKPLPGSLMMYSLRSSTPGLAPQLVPTAECTARDFRWNPNKPNVEGEADSGGGGKGDGADEDDEDAPEKIVWLPRGAFMSSSQLAVLTQQFPKWCRIFARVRQLPGGSVGGLDAGLPYFLSQLTAGFQGTNPVLFGRGLVVRYTSGHECNGHTRLLGETGGRLSALLSVETHENGTLGAAAVLPGTQFAGLNAPIARGCRVQGLEDPREIAPGVLLSGMQVRRRDGLCITQQVLLTNASNRIVRSPSGLLRSEKNWVAFGYSGLRSAAPSSAGSAGPLMVYSLFDAKGRTIFMRCGGVGEPKADARCRLTEAVYWDIHLVARIRSGSNWVPLVGRNQRGPLPADFQPKKLFSIAHQGRRIRARTRKGKDGKKEQTGLFGHFEYVSRIIVWDLVTDTLSVHKPTIFAPFSDDANARLNHMNRVEFVSSLRLDPDWPAWVWAGFGQSDCEAFVASFNAAEIVAELPVEHTLKVAKRVPFADGELARDDVEEIVGTLQFATFGMFDETTCPRKGCGGQCVSFKTRKSSTKARYTRVSHDDNTRT